MIICETWQLTQKLIETAQNAQRLQIIVGTTCNSNIPSSKRARNLQHTHAETPLPHMRWTTYPEPCRATNLPISASEPPKNFSCVKPKNDFGFPTRGFHSIFSIVFLILSVSELRFFSPRFRSFPVYSTNPFPKHQSIVSYTHSFVNRSF